MPWAGRREGGGTHTQGEKEVREGAHTHHVARGEEGGTHTHREARGKEGGTRIQYTGKLEVWEGAHIHNVKQEVKPRMCK